MEEFEVDKQIEFNIRAHDRIAKKYDAMHGEIFNVPEQTRLNQSLITAVKKVTSSSKPLKALDFGCGSGNLSKQLLDLNLDVTAADISNEFLSLVKSRYPTERLSTFKLNGINLSGMDNSHYDFIAMYSVLHHIPDYLSALKDLTHVCKPGGIIYIDHENSPAYWSNQPVYREFKEKALKFDWKKYLSFSNYIHKIRSLYIPRYTNEGDIHVWPDDHIEWDKIVELLTGNGFEVVISDDFLLYKKLYRAEIYDEYKDLCTDMRIMAFRKL